MKQPTTTIRQAIIVFLFAMFALKLITAAEERSTSTSTKIIVQHRKADAYTITTRTFELKNVNAADIAPLVRTAVSQRRTTSSVQSAVYKDNTQVLIVSAPQYRLAPGGDIENLIRKLDSMPGIDPNAEDVLIYQLKHRSPREVVKLVRLSLEDRGTVAIDKEGQSLIIKGSPSALREAKEMLHSIDYRHKERALTYTLYSLGDMNSKELSLKYERWKAMHEKGSPPSHTSGTNSFEVSRSYLKFLETNGVIKALTKGYIPLNKRSSTTPHRSKHNKGYSVQVSSQQFRNSTQLDLTIKNRGALIFSQSVQIPNNGKDHLITAGTRSSSIQQQGGTLGQNKAAVSGSNAEDELSTVLSVNISEIDGIISGEHKDTIDDIKSAFE